MMRSAFCIACFIFFASCYTKNRIPVDILPKHKMQAVMHDVILSESLSTEINRKDTSLKIDSLEAVYLTKVLSIQNISKAEFDKSYTFYKEHPMLMKEIIDSIQSQQPRNSSSDTLKLIPKISE